VLHPVNRYILIQRAPRASKGAPTIVLPEDYKPEQERFVEVNSIRSAPDVRFDIEHPATLIVDASMIEEISVEGTIYNVILDNYVMGILQ